MGWLEVDWEQPRPSEKVADSLWTSVQIRPISEIPADVEAYLTALRNVYTNGGAEFARFEIEGNSDFNWFATRNRFDEIEFIPRLLTHPVVRAELPDITNNPNRDAMAQFEWSNSLILDGYLAWALTSGGPYEHYQGSAREAKDLGARFCSALFDDRFLEVEVFLYHGGWSPWFKDIAWDFSYVIIDKGLQQVSLLFATDTD